MTFCALFIPSSSIRSRWRAAFPSVRTSPARSFPVCYESDCTPPSVRAPRFITKCSCPKPGTAVFWPLETAVWPAVLHGLPPSVPHGAFPPGVSEGYATIMPDMGTENGSVRGVGNPDVVRDFGWRAAERMTKIGKILTETYL